MKPAYDKHGKEIHEFDLLKVFHFTGARRKKHYMYKWVSVKMGHLYGLHLANNDGSGYVLQGNLMDTEIISSPWQDKEELKALGWKGIGL